MKVSIANGSLSFLYQLYDKLCFASFESTKAGLKHLKNMEKISEAQKLVDTAREKLVKKYKLEDKEKADEKTANEEYAKILSEMAEIELDEISESVVSQVKISPVEIRLLEDLKITKFEAD